MLDLKKLTLQIGSKSNLGYLLLPDLLNHNDIEYPMTGQNCLNRQIHRDYSFDQNLHKRKNIKTNRE